jgi:hypothetical protein
MLPPNAPTVQCCCGAALRHTNVDHAMRCFALALQLTLRQDIDVKFHRLLSKYASSTSVLLFKKKWRLFQVLFLDFS